jgi:heat-inducible transcriptional repressor
MLSNRRLQVLSALINEYIERAMPVGSRTIAERYALGVSPATVRNDLSALEEEGFITQPHTSAGRVPTDAGYRAFVDDLLASGLTDNTSAEMNKHAERLRAQADALDDLIARTNEEIARFTECLSIILPPVAQTGRVLQFSIVALGPTRALVIVAFDDGSVVNKQVALDDEYSAQDLFVLQENISSLITGKTLVEVLDEHIPEFVTYSYGQDASKVLECAFMGANDTNKRAANRTNLASLMTKPEFHESSTLLPLVHALENENSLMKTFIDQSNQGDIVIRIGHENESSELASVSVVAGTYGSGAGAGIVAVIGPTRMDYSRVISAVRTAQNILNL